MKTDNKVPRPLNSYIIFRVQKQREIVEQCPGANHRDISKITSKWWRELSAEEKQVYVDEAKRRKQEHRLLYPDYKFTPKKRSRSVRPYKKRPSNELIALDNDDKQNLLALYHHGTVNTSLETKQELINQIEPKLPKTSKRARTQSKRSASSESPMNSTPQFNFPSLDSFNPIHSQLLYPMNDANYYGLSPSYSSIVSHSPYEPQLFDDTYVPNYFLYHEQQQQQQQQPMYHFVPTEPIYPYEDGSFLKMDNVYVEPSTLQPIQLLTRPFPS